MPIIDNNGNRVIWFRESLIEHYAEFTAKALLKEFGAEQYTDKDRVRGILIFTLKGYIDQLRTIMDSNRSFGMYQIFQILHEHSNRIVITKCLEKDFPDITATDFAMYRRVLKIILEHSCFLPLIPGESINDSEERCLPVIEELIYIGFLIFDYTNLIASQELIPEALSISLMEGTLDINYQHYYNDVKGVINGHFSGLFQEAIDTTSEVSDLFKATDSCLGVSVLAVKNEIESMHEYLIKEKEEAHPYASAFDLHSLIDNLSNNYDVDYNQAQTITAGLLLDDQTIDDLDRVIRSPMTIYRYHYRPIVSWKIEGYEQKMVFAGIESTKIAINQLAMNAIGWEKLPKEWNNNCMKEYLRSKKDRFERIVEDYVEKKLLKRNIPYFRNVTHLRKHNNQNIAIDNEECGELDFIVLMNDKIVIGEVKHLVAKHDFNGWRADASKFLTGRKPYKHDTSKEDRFYGIKQRPPENTF